MHRIQIFKETDVHFAREGAHVFVAFQGEPKFSIADAMRLVGGSRLGLGTFDFLTKLTVIEASELLATCQKFHDLPLPAAVGRWARLATLRKQYMEVPFKGRQINWKELEKAVEATVKQEFPLCF